MVNFTSIQISKELRDKIAELGGKDDTFEQILWRLYTFRKLNEKYSKKDTELLDKKIQQEWENKVWGKDKTKMGLIKDKINKELKKRYGYLISTKTNLVIFVLFIGVLCLINWVFVLLMFSVILFSYTFLLGIDTILDIGKAETKRGKW